jgi:predicted dehydrogenase
MRKSFIWTLSAFALLMAGCGTQQKSQQTEKENMFTGATGEVKIITLDPGHFHAALVQKFSLDQVDPTVKVYAPEGPDLDGHIARIEGFNNRADEPTAWKMEVYRGNDFFEKMLADKPGNVVVTSGNNAKKTEYILKSVEAGLNVLADKPMVITPEQFPMLEQAFVKAGENGVLLYDIMTERYEITTILQRELSQIPEVFGQLQTGSLDEPAITKESIHHFSKVVSGNQLVRPAWFFDVNQQGEGIVDVTTHLVDLIQWEAFPEVVLNKSDVEILKATRWTTDLTPEMFRNVTRLDSYPDYLQNDVEGNILKVYSNGEINYKLKGIHAKASVIWNFEAPPGTGDTHYSIMRGTKCNVEIRQGAAENFQTTLYIQPLEGEDISAFGGALDKAFNEILTVKYPGVKLVKINDKLWTVEVPAEYKVGHEAHFTQVAQKYLGFLVDGKMPDWEIPNMIVKYYTTTEALKRAKQ